MVGQAGKLHTALTTRLSSIVDGLSKEDARAASVFVRMECRLVEAPSVIFFWLLVDVWQSPKAQYFAKCHLASDPLSTFADLHYPFVVRISCADLRLPGNIGRNALDICTSDELAQRCLACGAAWDISRASYTIDLDSPSLMQMIVDGHGAPVAPPPPKNAKSVATSLASKISSLLPDCLEVDDPLSGDVEVKSFAGASGAAYVEVWPGGLRTSK